MTGLWLTLGAITQRILMDRANLTYGVEGEFLNLNNRGKIQNLTNIVLAPEDEVGVDGHNETIELRTQPSSSVLDQLSRVEIAIHKYHAALQESRRPHLLQGTPIRGGAYYGTPLSIHLHFGNFDSSLVYPMVLLLQHTLDTGFIAHIDNPVERGARQSLGYGLPDLASCIRVKGNRWWEWRQPSSVITPACMKVLLGTSEVLAQYLHQAPKKEVGDLRKRLKGAKPLTFSAFLEAYDITDTDTEVSPFEIQSLMEGVLQLSPFDWKQNLLPQWIEGDNKSGPDNT